MSATFVFDGPYSRHASVPGPIPFFTYYHEDHDELLAKLQICEHYGAIYDIRRNQVPRWNLSEDFAEYLLGV
ncbi:hypothetical protein ASG42_27890 [Rhizobium sp. Leaf391]|nr:hypothetical protein ASG42_27890 [Rhizobium sp. Leaf391]